jgi:hypothetical protein
VPWRLGLIRRFENTLITIGIGNDLIEHAIKSMIVEICYFQV